MNRKIRANVNQVLIQFPQMEYVNETQADRIINYLLASTTPKRVSEIATDLKIAVASTSRTLQELFKGGYVLRPGKTELSMNDLSDEGKPKTMLCRYKSAYCITKETIRKYFDDRLN